VVVRPGVPPLLDEPGDAFRLERTVWWSVAIISHNTSML